MIVANKLTKHFRDLRRGKVVAVQGATFVCRPGEIFGLLGPNGAGKTTVLRMLSTVLRPTSGTAEVAGHDVVDDPEQVRRQIGFMSANTSIYDRMTAYEMVEYFGRLYGMDEPALKARLEHIFDWLQMHDFRDVLGQKLSTGMKQKVSIARAIVHDPPVLIFDEPTVGLDVLVARAVLDNILELRRLGKCIIFSTHIMREVERLCDQVAIIHRGRILTDGTLEEVLQKHGQPDLEELFFHLVVDGEETRPEGRG